MTNKVDEGLRIAEVLRTLKHGLIVSCQATPGTAMDFPDFIRAQALTVESAGAIAIRAQGLANVKAVVEAVKVPVIGLIKDFSDESDVYITPKVEDVLALAEVGADIIAVDATTRKRLNGMSLETFYTEVRKHSNVPLLADIDSLENALNAEKLGFDAIATTLNGYTDSPSPGLPNLDLISNIFQNVKIPIIAEGGFSQPGQVKDAIQRGAWAVCVGTAITNPYLLTKHFLEESF